MAWILKARATLTGEARRQAAEPDRHSRPEGACIAKASPRLTALVPAMTLSEAIESAYPLHGCLVQTRR
jgi:hypothetical protein